MRVLVAFDGHRWYIRRVLCVTHGFNNHEVRYDAEVIRGATRGFDSVEEALSKVARKRRAGGGRK